MTTLVAYPDADPESTTVDGRVGRTGVDETFATIRAGAGNATDATVATIQIILQASTTSNQFQILRRFIALFDTSSIPSGDTVSSAVLSLFGASKTNGIGDCDVDIVTSNPASNTALANADYANVGGTALATKAYSALSTTDYSDFTLSTGDVTKAGITKLGARLTWDRSGTFGGTWASGAQSRWTIYTADQTGTTNDPKLTVVYSTPASGRRAMVIS